MSETDNIQIGDEMPRIGAVAAQDLYRVVVSWIEGPRRGRADLVDLAPVILTLKLYRPLRDNLTAFKTVRSDHDGGALVWETKDEIDMAATTVERLAEETMAAADFKAFLERNNLSLDAAAAQLGLSRRMVAYYAAGHEIPRHVALACKYLEGACEERLVQVSRHNTAPTLLYQAEDWARVALGGAIALEGPVLVAPGRHELLEAPALPMDSIMEHRKQASGGRQRRRRRPVLGNPVK